MTKADCYSGGSFTEISGICIRIRNRVKMGCRLTGCDGGKRPLPFTATDNQPVPISAVVTKKPANLDSSTLRRVSILKGTKVESVPHSMNPCLIKFSKDPISSTFASLYWKSRLAIVQVQWLGRESRLATANEVWYGCESRLLGGLGGLPPGQGIETSSRYPG